VSQTPSNIAGTHNKQNHLTTFKERMTKVMTEKKNIHVAAYMSLEEKARLEAAAFGAGLPVSRLCTSILRDWMENNADKIDQAAFARITESGVSGAC
jgi:hypothetical protein